jgi:hypothetical protein
MRVADASSTAPSRAPRQAEEVRIQKDVAPPAETSAGDAEKKEVMSGKDAETIGRPAPIKHQKAAKSLSAPVPEYKYEGPGYHADAVMKSKEQYAAPAAPQLLSAAVSRTDRIDVVIHVGNVGAAVEEVEKLLGKFDARNTRKQFREDSTILTTELKAENTAEFLQKLKAVGKIEQKDVLTDARGQYISITIELRK